MERWKVIPNFPDYEVSDHGRVKSHKKRGHPKIMSTHLDMWGYKNLTIRNESGGKYTNVQRLVLMAFVGLPPNGYQCNHTSTVVRGFNFKQKFTRPRFSTYIGF